MKTYLCTIQATESGLTVTSPTGTAKHVSFANLADNAANLWTEVRTMGGTAMRNLTAGIMREVLALAQVRQPVIKKGFFTIQSDETHWTFRIKTNRKGQTLMGLMDGTDNESSYVWFGFVSDEGVIRFWRQANRGFDNPATLRISHSFAQECLNTIIGNPDEAGKLYARESKRCSRCNKLLTNPDSLDANFGPECVKYKYF
jgi:Family of unknown function (DUF6011)